MNTLLLDVKIYIASFDENVWITMALYDKEFSKYAYKKEGLTLFVDRFHKVINNETFLFGKLHSINDLPASIDANGNKFWFYDGLNHRNNDLPASIYNETQIWFYNGSIHRENDLPAVMYTGGAQEWFYEGERHRENNLPAIIHTRVMEWWIHDELIKHECINMNTKLNICKK